MQVPACFLLFFLSTINPYSVLVVPTDWSAFTDLNVFRCTKSIRFISGPWLVTYRSCLFTLLPVQLLTQSRSGLIQTSRLNWRISGFKMRPFLWSGCCEINTRYFAQLFRLKTTMPKLWGAVIIANLWLVSCVYTTKIGASCGLWPLG